jgi:tRNA uracil 4-sulfurtransferase
MYQAFLIKYGEIAIKGKNRKMFEDALVHQIKYALKKAEGRFQVRKEQGRIYVEALEEDYDVDEVIGLLQTVFGIVGICPVVLKEDKGTEQLSKDVVDFIRETYGDDPNFSFKVNARRARKNFPMNSMEINAFVGEKILNAFPNLHVDVHKPEETIYVEIREEICIYSKIIPGPCGMPVGTSGKAMLLLSGGIDSPVAGYMIAKRGCKIDATYFHAPPYTSERAKEKVVDLAKIISKYSGPVYLNVVNFTDIQLYIYDKCPHDELTIIMRRYMMRIAEHFAKEGGSLGLVTGESIAQVASQTMQSLACTNDVCTLPVYRPLIGFDKNEIIERSEKIGAYETSILPYEDCCTIFVAKHPVTKPKVEVIRKSELKLAEKIDELVQTAIETTQTLVVTENEVRELKPAAKEEASNKEEEVIELS